MMATMTVAELEQALLRLFPACYAESWDRTGLLVGDPNQLVTRVAVALDANCNTVREAQECGANVLLTHHPAYLTPPERFCPLSSMAECTSSSAPAFYGPGSCVYEAIRQGVALMNFHTALDVSLRAQLELPALLELDPCDAVVLPCQSGSAVGYGRVCQVSDPQPLTLELLAKRAALAFDRTPRVWGKPQTVLQSVAVCTGAEGGVARAAVEAQLDCVVCGEIKYHEALDVSQAGLCIVELGHDASELPLRFTLEDALLELGLSEDQISVIDNEPHWFSPREYEHDEGL